jgi:hypothetical protein
LYEIIRETSQDGIALAKVRGGVAKGAEDMTDGSLL